MKLILFGVAMILLVLSLGLKAQQPQINCLNELGNMYLQARALADENQNLKAKMAELEAKLKPAAPAEKK